MDEDLWSAVDGYYAELFLPQDEALAAAQESSAAARLPAISVSPLQGRLLWQLVRMAAARNVLEIGTLGGYSTIWLARALPPDGRLVTLEFEPKHAAVATGNLARAGVSDRVEVRVGPALDTLPRLAAEGYGPFDFIFIDADKPSYPEYFQWAVRLARRGTVIVVDNVVREGAVVEPESSDERVQGVRRLNELIAAEARVRATVVQTVGSKGYDGFAVLLVDGE